MTKRFCSIPKAILFILRLALLAGMMQGSRYKILHEYVKLGNFEEVRLLITPTKRVEIGAAAAKPCNVDDEQTKKRRCINEAATCLDPSYNSNMVTYLAVEYGHYVIVDLLLNDPRVRANIDLADLLNFAVELHHSLVAERILEESAVFSLEDVFVRTCENSNADFLEVLVTPERLGRLNLIHSVPTAIESLAKQDDCAEIFYFFMTCPHIKVLPFDRNPILLWAMEHTYDTILYFFFSDPDFYFEAYTVLEAFRVDAQLCSIMIFAHQNANIEALEAVTSGPTDYVDYAAMKCFMGAATLKGVELEYEIEYPMLAIACQQDSQEKIEYVLEHIKTCLPNRIVNMLLNVCCMAGKSNMLHILLQNSTVCRNADKNALDSLVQMSLKQRDPFSLKLVLAALCLTEPGLGMDKYILPGTDGGGEGSKELDALRRISASELRFAEEYQKNGFKWLAALIRAAVAHHNAILTIAAGPYHFPPEVADLILMHGFLNLASFYRAK